MTPDSTKPEIAMKRESDRQFAAVSLTDALVRQAYPLVHAAAPEISLEEWRSHVTSLASREPANRGIIAIVSTEGHIHGLFAYTVSDELQLGRALTIDHLIVPDLFRRETLVAAMDDAMEGLCEKYSCAGQKIRLPGPIPSSEAPAMPDAPAVTALSLADLFVEQGHEIGGFELWKRRSQNGGR
jgi:hypothetical protein